MIATDVRKISRVPISVIEENVEASLRGDVINKANELFGYKAESFNALGILAKALNQLSITPLDIVQVKMYMKSKEKTWVTYGATYFRLALTVGVGLIALVTNLYIGLGTNLEAGTKVNWIMPISLGTLLLLFVLNALIFDDNPFNNRKYKKSWNKYAFGSVTEHEYNYDNRGYKTALEIYDKYIPVHVLNQAIQIKGLVPDARFIIHELTVSYENIPKPLPDPFMEVVLGAERYFIGVWDEREFEAKM